MRRIWTLVGGMAMAVAAVGCGSSSIHASVPPTTLVPPTTATGTATGAAPGDGTGSPTTTSIVKNVGGTSSISSRPTSTTVGGSGNVGTAASGPTPPQTPTTSPTATCTSLAASTLVHLTSGVHGASDHDTFTGTPVSVHCGGPDDVQYSVASSPVEHLTVSPSATVVEYNLGGATPGPVQIAPDVLAGYLTTDEDTRIFQVTGSLDDVTGLSEIYHP